MTRTELKALRTYLGLTQQQFAESIGTAKPRVCDWEKGRRAISSAYQKLIQHKYSKELNSLS